MESLPSATRALIQEELKTRDPRTVARSLGIPLSHILVVPPPSRHDPVSEDGLGRQELRQYLVSRKSVRDPKWPDEDAEKIELARDLYDDGIVEVCQGRDGNWMLLYSIPRAEPEEGREVYFARNFGEE